LMRFQTCAPLLRVPLRPSWRPAQEGVSDGRVVSCGYGNISGVGAVRPDGRPPRKTGYAPEPPSELRADATGSDSDPLSPTTPIAADFEIYLAAIRHVGALPRIRVAAAHYESYELFRRLCRSYAAAQHRSRTAGRDAAA